MPGLVAFRRRWGVGSDDLVVPGLLLFVIHLSWLVVLCVGLSVGKFEAPCSHLLYIYLWVYVALLLAGMCLEAALSIASLRGGILDTEPRSSVKYIIYFRLAVMLVEVVWLICATTWLSMNYPHCPLGSVKEAILGMVICNWVVIFTVILTVWCVFDAAGRSWVKMKKYQRSMKESESRFQYKRSGNRARNWRQRKVLRAYQHSWDHRCRLLFCCIRNSDRSKNSFTDIARLLSDFFRDLDVVPSDVVAGLVLLRKFQKIERESNVSQRKNDTYEYLSGVAVTPRTKFLPLGDMQHYQHFQAVTHFMHYALAAYGWPMYILTTPVVSLCKLSRNLSCLLCQTNHRVQGDNCCGCNYAALKGMLSKGQAVIVYATYHVDVAETPFFVAIDFSRNKIVVSIRGTLSMKDVITDLNAESETLPLDPPREDWLGHKGMVHAAVYIRDKLLTEKILHEAYTLAAQEKPQETFGLVLVGHSLGAGTASILAILLRQTYPDLQCFAYSPPGGLLSMPAVQYTKSFITSVVLGKDVVPRIGLYQMESLRADLINAIKRSKDPKWKTITCSVFCCGCASMPTSAVELKADSATMQAYQLEKNAAREAAVHPSDNTIALTLHQPLYPPGSIIHIVRHHPSKTEQVLKKHDPVYQAIWANNTDFDEVLISPVMIQDHMPDKVLEALNKVLHHYNKNKHRVAVRTLSDIAQAPLENGLNDIRRRGSALMENEMLLINELRVITSLGPAKPQRALSNNHNNNNAGPAEVEHCQLLAGSSGSNTPPHRLCLETSFTSSNPPQQQQPPAIHLQLPSVAFPRPEESDSTSHLPWEFVSLVSPSLSERRADESLRDDWFGGLAPLATPESFSEVSSICSRTSSTVLYHKRKRKRGIKESHSVRFDETLNDITDVSESYHVEPHRGSILSRLFRKKKKEVERTPSPPPLPAPPPLPPQEQPVKSEESVTTSTESSPLLSSLHLLTDQRLAEILGRPLTANDDATSRSSCSSFRSAGQSLQDIPGTVSSDSVTVNAEVHQSPEILSALRSESSLGGDSLLEDIERSLNMSLSRTGSSAKLSLSRTGSSARLSLSRTGSTAKLTEVEIDISDPPVRPSSEAHPTGTGNKYMYPILLVGHGESSV